MRLPAGLALALLVAGLLGCAQTDPESVCSHIAELQHASAPNAKDRIADYKRLCKAPMTQARIERPTEYKCWSKCIVETKSWPETTRCDGCVGASSGFDLFQLSKTRKRQDDKAKGPPAASIAPAPLEGGTCTADADCKP